MGFPIFMMGLSVFFILGCVINYKEFVTKKERIGISILIAIWILNFLINAFSLYQIVGEK